MSYVIGLFDEAHLNEMLEQLKDRGLEEHYRVIDRGTLQTAGLVAVPGTEQNSAAAVVGPTSTLHAATDLGTEDVDDVLGKYGFSDEEKAFFIRSVANGASLLVVEVPSDQVDVVAQMMEKAQAQHVYIGG